MTTLLSNTQVNNDVNWAAPRLSVAFTSGSGSFSSDTWRVSFCERTDGPRPGRCEIVIPQPAASVHDNNNLVAFNPAGPAADIKKFCAVTIYRIFTNGGDSIWTGVVVNTWHDRDTGALIVEAFDDRWWLETVRIVGRWILVTPTSVSDEYQTTELAFQQGVPCWFNRNGPDRLYADGGGDGKFTPVFAPHPNFGLEDGEAPSAPGDTGAGTSKAGWWSFGDIMAYLYAFYHSASPTVASFPWIARAPEWLRWPASFAANLDSESVGNFNGGAGSSATNSPRKGRSINLEGMSLLDAFDTLFATAGNYTVDVAPLAEDGAQRAELRCVPTRYNGSNARTLYMPASGQSDGECITGGRYGEIGRDFITGCAGSGSRVLVEQRCSTKAVDGAQQLRPAWTAYRQQQFLAAAAGQTVTINGKEIVGNTVAGPDSWELACRLFPEVLTTWRLDKIFDASADTCFSSFPYARINRPVYPTQLTLQSDAGAANYAYLRCPLYVEVETATSPSEVWDLAGQFDGLEVWDNGMIYLPMLRDLSSSMRAWGWTGAAWAVSGGALAVSIRNIRMNLGIPLDHNLTAFAEVSGGATLGAGEMLEASPDAALIDPSVQRTDYRDLSSAKYACELRKATSYSRPESRGYSADEERSGSDYTDIKPEKALRSDHAMLKAHVRRIVRENSRLKRDGTLRLDGMLLNYDVGWQISQFNRGEGQAPYPANAVLRGIRWVVEQDRCYTMLRLG